MQRDKRKTGQKEKQEREARTVMSDCHTRILCCGLVCFRPQNKFYVARFFISTIMRPTKFLMCNWGLFFFYKCQGVFLMCSLWVLFPHCYGPQRIYVLHDIKLKFSTNIGLKLKHLIKCKTIFMAYWLTHLSPQRVSKLRTPRPAPGWTRPIGEPQAIYITVTLSPNLPDAWLKRYLIRRCLTNGCSSLIEMTQTRLYFTIMTHNYAAWNGILSLCLINSLTRMNNVCNVCVFIFNPKLF